MKERHDIIKFLENSEQKYSVLNWNYNDIDLWPIVKMLLFFTVQKKDSIKNSGILSYVFKKSFSKIDSLKKKVIKKEQFGSNITYDIKKYDYIFCSTNTAREQLNDKSVSKFFDPIMDKIETNSIHFDYHPLNLDNCYKKERVIDFHNFTRGLPKFATVSIDVSSNPELIALLQQYELQFGISQKKMVKKINNYIINTYNYYRKWLYILEQITPKLIMLICYYNDIMFGLVFAAKKLKIPVVDMQHGGQGKFHPMYAFTDIKISKLNTIPDGFWLWDQNYCEGIQNWLPEGEKNRAVVGGNPWLDFTENNFDNELKQFKNIVYTLQIGIVPYFPDVIKNAIQNTPADYKWHIRLHPRMPKTEVAEIKKQLTLISNDRVEDIEKSNNIPLPAMLKNAEIHISRFSGSVAEADMMNVPYNITIDQLGKENFSKIFNEGRLHFISPESDNFFYEISKHLPNKKTNKNDSFNYELICNRLQKLNN